MSYCNFITHEFVKKIIFNLIKKKIKNLRKLRAGGILFNKKIKKINSQEKVNNF